jgi:putative heme-binding domain-containing protein
MLDMFTRAATVLLAVALAQAQDDLVQGQKLYDAQCALCHGIGGGGGRGPRLAAAKLRRAPTRAALEKLIEEGIPGTEMPGSWQLSPRELSHVAAYVLSLSAAPAQALPGDAARGRALYAEQRCNACHIVNGEGEGFGPELSEIGARRSAAYLRQSLVEPNAAFPESYQTIEITRRAGGKLQGVQLNEDNFHVQLLDTSRRLQTVPKAEIQSLARPKRSLMPAYARLSAAQLDDLVAYLASLQERKPACCR